MTCKEIMGNSIDKNYKYYLIVLFFYIAAIFYLSSQSDSSLSIGDSKTERMIWNLGHIPLYSILGIILYFVITSIINPPPGKFICSMLVFIIGITVGVVDELMQSFSQGRMTSALDIILDVTGIAIAVLFMNKRFAG